MAAREEAWPTAARDAEPEAKAVRSLQFEMSTVRNAVNYVRPLAGKWNTNDKQIKPPAGHFPG